MRTPIPKSHRTNRVDVEPPGAGAGLGDSQEATSLTLGDLKKKRTVRKTPATATDVPRGPAPSPDDDVLRTLGRLLLEHGRLCRGRGGSGPFDGADPAGRVAALREAIGDQLACSEPGSKAARLLRGLRVLVEVEAIAPGHRDDLRREADGWSSPLSLARGRPGRQAGERVAKEYRVDADEIGADVKFAESVEAIARNCGDGALGLLMTPGNRLKEGVILKVARKGLERQRYVMEQVARGLDPLARPAGGVWPMDTRDFAKVPGRQGRALGNVERVIADVPRMPPGSGPTPGEEAEILRHLEGIASLSPQFLQQDEGRGTMPPASGGMAGGRPSESVGDDKPPSVKTFAQVRGRLDSAHCFVEKCLKDVPRLRPDVRPTPEQLAVIREKLRSLFDRSREAHRLISAPRTPRRGRASRRI